MEDGFGFPEVQENPQAQDGDDGGNDGRQVRTHEVGNHELGDRKAETGHDDGRQDFHGRFQPLMVTDSHRGTIRDKKGSCRPTILLMCIMSRPVTPAATTMGMPMAAEGHGRGVGDEADAGGVAGVESQAHQHGRGNGHGGAEPGGAFNEGPEGKGNEQGLEAAVIGDAGQGVLDDLEVAAFHRHVVHPNGRHDDPDDGEDAEGHPI